MVKLINTTEFFIRFFDNEGDVMIELPPVDVFKIEKEHTAGPKQIPMKITEERIKIDLPKMAINTLYIVDPDIAYRFKRYDFLTYDFPVYDEDGITIGYKMLKRIF